MNKTTIEYALANAEPAPEGQSPVRWYGVDRLILANGAPMATTGDAKVGALEAGTTDLIALCRWEADADSNDQASVVIPITNHYDTATDRIRVRGRFRKDDLTGSAVDNANLAMVLAARTFKPGDTGGVAVTNAAWTKTFANAPTQSNAFASFEEFEWDLRGLLLTPKSVLILDFGPNETVGTDLQITCLGIDIGIHEHVVSRVAADRSIPSA